jgi:hypothetical protein
MVGSSYRRKRPGFPFKEIRRREMVLSARTDGAIRTGARPFPLTAT